jgi:hypothetical protein
MSEDLPRERRVYISMSGFGIQRVLMVAMLGSALVGTMLGDIWLWRLIHG